MYKMFFIIVLSTFSILSHASSKLPAKKYLKQCLSSREYITTVRFLRSKKDFSLEEKQIRLISDEVSKGCTGSSKRFIIITNLLVKTGLDSKSSLKMALKFTKKSDKEVKTFTYIFKRSFLKKFLDLDLKSSIEIAYLLADKFDGNYSNSQRTFNQVLRLCNDESQLDMPNKKCAHLAARIAKLGEHYKKPLGDSFKKLFHYLLKSDGPNLATFNAIKLAEEIVKEGPYTAVNFIQAYKFASSKKGLSLPVGNSIKFAQKLARRSLTIQDALK